MKYEFVRVCDILQISELIGRGRTPCLVKYFEINSPNHMIPKIERAIAFIVLMLGFIMLLTQELKAQTVVRKGNNFIEQKDSINRAGATKTDYIYTDKSGVSDTVYLSKNGNAFIWKISKSTGKQYRKYLPEVTKQLGTKKQ